MNITTPNLDMPKHDRSAGYFAEAIEAAKLALTTAVTERRPINEIAMLCYSLWLAERLFSGASLGGFSAPIYTDGFLAGAKHFSRVSPLVFVENVAYGIAGQYRFYIIPRATAKVYLVEDYRSSDTIIFEGPAHLMTEKLAISLCNEHHSTFINRWLQPAEPAEPEAGAE